MTPSDATFTGSIPAVYDRHLGPMFFEPYAEDLALRVASSSPRDVLETAAGSGIVTRALFAQLGERATIIASDINPAMLSVAAAASWARTVSWRQADAMALPFGDASFDLVACQFGVMFFPDKRRAFSEVRRVLKRGGRFVFSVWEQLELNEVAHVVAESVAASFPDNPPTLARRVAHGFFDEAIIRALLLEAGFDVVVSEHVKRRSRAPSARDAAVGLCQGTPIRGEIDSRDASRLDEVTATATQALVQRFGAGAIDGSMEAIVFEATAA
ncbi:MAG: methyltransferase domain-containing protein [Myxococcales bacterium]|nr:methyltransferase domain-containing protein [Myxococcales bacterium]